MNHKKEYERLGKEFFEAVEYQRKLRGMSFFQWVKHFFTKDRA